MLKIFSIPPPEKNKTNCDLRPHPKMPRFAKNGAFQVIIQISPFISISCRNFQTVVSSTKMPITYWNLVGTYKKMLSACQYKKCCLKTLLFGMNKPNSIMMVNTGQEWPKIVKFGLKRPSFFLHRSFPVFNL